MRAVFILVLWDGFFQFLNSRLWLSTVPPEKCQFAQYVLVILMMNVSRVQVKVLIKSIKRQLNKRALMMIMTNFLHMTGSYPLTIFLAMTLMTQRPLC